MTFSNPARSSPAATSSYVRALLDLLGTRDPIEVLGELIPWVDQRIMGIDEPTLRRPELPGKWSAIEVIQHLADSELVAGFRVRMVLTEEQPALQGYDQDRWASEFHYREAELSRSLDQLRALRTANLHLWSHLSPMQLARIGLHSERGPESAGQLLRLMAAHDLVHRRQLDRILATVGHRVTA
jgi:DinB family protein